MIIYICNNCNHNKCEYFILRSRAHLKCKKCENVTIFEEDTESIDFSNVNDERLLNHVWNVIKRNTENHTIDKQKLYQLSKPNVRKVKELNIILHELKERKLINILYGSDKGNKEIIKVY